MAKMTEKAKAERSAICITAIEGQDDPDDVRARTLTRPEVQAASLIQRLEGENHEVMPSSASWRNKSLRFAQEISLVARRCW